MADAYFASILAVRPATVVKACQPAPAPITLMQLRQAVGSFPDEPSESFTLQIGRSKSGTAIFDFGAGRFASTINGTLVVTPPHSALSFNLNAPHDVLIASFDAAIVHRAQDEAGLSTRDDLGRLHGQPVRDAALRSVLHHLWREVEQGSCFGPLYADAAAAALGARLVELSSERSTRRSSPLVQPYLNRVLARLDADLAEQVRIEELAKSVRLTPFHFIRAFRGATGVTPHRYRLMKKVAAAQRMLLTGQDTVEVALACGFSDQSHLTNAFKRAVGVAPSRWRKLRAS